MTHSHRRGLIRLALLVAVLLSGVLGGGLAAARTESPASADDARPGELLVQTRRGVPPAQVARRAGAEVGETFGRDVWRVRVPAGTERTHIERLRRDADVVAVARNFRRRAQVVPNDRYYGQQWALSRIEAPAAWDITTATQDITIAILDSGVDLRHPDLTARLLPGINLLDADPNAVASDCAPHSDVQDDFGHGTHVAGIAAASTDNAIGIAGVAFRARILPVKVLDCHGNGSDAQLIAGIDWAIAHGARLINLSIGGPGRSDVLDAAVQRAWDAGVMIVAAAGNSATTEPFYPAASPRAVAVTATDSNDRLASFANRGSYIALAAPGTSILSTYPTDRSDWHLEPGYQFKSGTSMASPIIAGVAALVWALHSDYPIDRVLSVLAGSADRPTVCPDGVSTCPYDGLGRNAYYGYGRVNAGRALRMVGRAQMPLVPTTTAARLFGRD